MRTLKHNLARLMMLTLLTTTVVLPARHAFAQTAKTRIVDRILDPSGNPRQGKVTFILTRKVSSPAGIIPVGATVSASLDSSGRFDISVFPSATLTPTTYYQVWYAGSNGGNELIGIYNIPASSSIISLGAYRVTDANLAAQYTFASVADVNSLVTEVSTATLARLNGVVRTNNKVQVYKSASGTFEDSPITATSSAVTVAVPTTINGATTVNGTLTATNLVGNGAGITGLSGATGGVANTGSTTIGADTDVNGVGKISLQTGGVERVSIEADGIVKLGGVVHATPGTGDAGAKIVAAIDACPSAGCVVDARGVTGTISQNLFAGLDGSKPVTLLLGAGTYVVTVEQKYETALARAAGMKIIGAGIDATFIDNQVEDGAAFTFDGTNAGASSFTFQQSAELRDFTIMQTLAPVGSRGIDIRANWNMRISGVRVDGLTSDGIRVISSSPSPTSTGDADSTSYLDLTHVELINNGTYGFNTTITNNPSSITSVTFRNCLIEQNAIGGIRYIGFQLRVESSSVSYNNTSDSASGGGLLHLAGEPDDLPNTRLTRDGLIVTNCEFDTNGIVNLYVESARSGQISENRFLTQPGTPVTQPATVVKIGSATPSTFTLGMWFTRNYFRKEISTFTATLITVGSNATGVVLDNNDFSGVISTNTTYYSDSGVHTVIREAGRQVSIPMTAVAANRADGESYTPNLQSGPYHRISITSAGAVTINAPINFSTTAGGSYELNLDILNSSGGSVTVTFNAVYAHGGFVAPADGKRRTARFLFEPVGGKWVLNGSWSPDF